MRRVYRQNLLRWLLSALLIATMTMPPACATLTPRVMFRIGMFGQRRVIVTFMAALTTSLPITVTPTTVIRTFLGMIH